MCAYLPELNSMQFCRKNLTAWLVLLVWVPSFAILCGCEADSKATGTVTPKAPKPVSVMALNRSTPSFEPHTTASVAAWKAERIGFEQAGRVVAVIEPSEMVKGGPRNVGDPLARLDDEKFRIAVDAAQADASVAKRRSEANQISIQQRLPAAIKTAQAELQLALNELARAKRLANSISKSELDTARTRASTARLRVASVTSELAQANAEQLALDAQVQQAQQRVAEAERNLKNTVLFSSFPGQVAEVHVVPGTYVKEGDPIVTVQMVDPMLVEFEVTADNSRRYQRGDSLAVTLTNHLGQPQILTGMVYTVDTVADSNTRTFTVSLHVRNKTESESLEVANRTNVARTENIYPLNLGPIITGDKRLLVEESAVHRINGQSYVWRILNRNWDSPSDASQRELAVEKLKVKVTSDVLPFLGTWKFVAVEFEDPQAVDLERDLITGKLFFDAERETGETGDAGEETPAIENWTGDRVLMDHARWMLRAGDTVRVTMIADSSVQGFYVPMKAVRREDGQTFIHVLDDDERSDGRADLDALVKRVSVNVTSDDSVSGDTLLICIEPSTETPLVQGMQIVVGGTHYLDDGDRVRIVPTKRQTEGGR
jgi:multidrug resistance efflux pump